MRKSFILVIFVLLYLSCVTLFNLVDDWGRLEGGWENLTIFVTESMWPPNWSVLEAQSYPVCEKDIEFFCSVGYLGMVETIKIAFVSTILGFIGALCLSSFAARNLVPMYIALPFRFILAATRSLPSLIWAILFVIVIGFGPLAGVLAMTFYTIGYLGKLQYETFEGMPSDALEVSKAMGLLTRNNIHFSCDSRNRESSSQSIDVHVRIQCTARNSHRNCRSWWHRLLHQHIHEILAIRQGFGTVDDHIRGSCRH